MENSIILDLKNIPSKLPLSCYFVDSQTNDYDVLFEELGKRYNKKTILVIDGDQISSLGTDKIIGFIKRKQFFSFAKIIVFKSSSLNIDLMTKVLNNFDHSCPFIFYSFASSEIKELLETKQIIISEGKLEDKKSLFTLLRSNKSSSLKILAFSLVCYVGVYAASYSLSPNVENAIIFSMINDAKESQYGCSFAIYESANLNLANNRDSYVRNAIAKSFNPGRETSLMNFGISLADEDHSLTDFKITIGGLDIAEETRVIATPTVGYINATGGLNTTFYNMFDSLNLYRKDKINNDWNFYSGADGVCYLPQAIADRYIEEYYENTSTLLTYGNLYKANGSSTYIEVIDKKSDSVLCTLAIANIIEENKGHANAFNSFFGDYLYVPSTNPLIKENSSDYKQVVFSSISPSYFATKYNFENVLKKNWLTEDKFFHYYEENDLWFLNQNASSISDIYANLESPLLSSSDSFFLSIIFIIFFVFLALNLFFSIEVFNRLSDSKVRWSFSSIAMAFFFMLSPLAAINLLFSIFSIASGKAFWSMLLFGSVGSIFSVTMLAFCTMMFCIVMIIHASKNATVKQVGDEKANK
jgi:hypothetical protein